MTGERQEEVLEALLDARAAGATTPSPPRSKQNADDDVEALLNVADLLWEAAHGAPPLDEDPVAAMLGLVPSPEYRLDPKALARARKAAGLKAGELAARLVARGWSVSGGDVFTWENRSTPEVSPALIRAIAEETGRSSDDLVTTQAWDPLEAEVSTALESSRFQQLVERWAALQGVSITLAGAELRSRVLATVHRGDRPSPDQLLDSLNALLVAKERSGGSDGP